MSTSRKIFIESVNLPALTATSLASLMRSSIQHWGLESDLITPSLDSITGSNAIVKPDAQVFVGNDANVRDANASPLYKGITIAAGATFNLADVGSAFGIIDPNQIYFFNQSGCNMDVTFEAR